MWLCHHIVYIIALQETKKFMSPCKSEEFLIDIMPLKTQGH